MWLLIGSHQLGYFGKQLVRDDHQMAMEYLCLADHRGKPRIMGGAFHPSDMGLLHPERFSHGFLGQPFPAPHDGKLGRQREMRELLGVLFSKFRIFSEHLLKMRIESTLGHFSHIPHIRFLASRISSKGVFFSMANSGSLRSSFII